MKQTKGKQKIEMKKVETYGDRMITFSKRKGGIFKKMNEIITMCDVEAAFLVFSQAGKPYSFAHPSMENVANRLMNHIDHQQCVKNDNTQTGALFEAYKKRKIEKLMQEYLTLNDQFELETETLKILKGSRNDEKEMNKLWWNIYSVGDLSLEGSEQRHQAFVDLHDSLCDLAFLRLEKDDDDGLGSGREGLGPCGSDDV